jgi:hypothetical protein
VLTDTRRLLADVWPARALPGVLRALGGAPRLVLRFWEHYEVPPSRHPPLTTVQLSAICPVLPTFVWGHTSNRGCRKM